MRNVIAHGKVQDEDAWSLVPPGETWTDKSAPIVSLNDALTQLDALRTHGVFGVWFEGGENLEPLQTVLPYVKLVAVRFPVFTDGRGFSSAVLVRRLGYTGELRAIGDVLRDQLLQMKRVGFTSFAVREDHDANDALLAFGEFTDAYQGVAGEPLPWFKRRTTTVGAL